MEICNSSGTAWLYLETCAVSCGAGLCTGACTPGERRCNGVRVETCEPSGAAWATTETCSSNLCDAQAAQCALPGLDVATDQNLDGVVIVKGAVVVRSGATLTAPSGSLTLIADSITVQNGGAIVVAPTGDTAAGRGADGKYYYSGAPSYTYFGSGGGGGGHVVQGATGSYGGSVAWGGVGGASYGIKLDFSIQAGASGGRGGVQTGVGVAGGKGGGVLRLIAPVIDMAGQINADGQRGTNSVSGGSYAGGGGGGSGGGVLLAADRLTMTGAISAAGGFGGTGVYNGGQGGNGALGRVKLLSGAYRSLTGSVTGERTEELLPPLTITSSTHPSALHTYNDDFSDLRLTWNKPFPSVQGYYQLLNGTRTTIPTPGNGQFLAEESLLLARTQLVQGSNFFHIVPVDGSSVVGGLQGWFEVKVNTLPPAVTSSSHPSPAAWNANNTAFFSWTYPLVDEDLVGGYYVRDAFANTVPTKADTFVPVTQKQQILSGLPSGVWFFHLVSVDTQGYLTKQAAHYQVRIGADPGVGTLYGQVIDGSSQPVSGVTLSVNRGLFSGTSNATGNFNLQNVIAGTWEVMATKVPYAPVVKSVTVASGGSTTVNFTLQ